MLWPCASSRTILAKSRSPQRRNAKPTQRSLPTQCAGPNPTLPERAGTFSAFRVSDCEFSEFAGDGEGACWSISLAGCNERCICCAEREAPCAVPPSPFGKLAICDIFAAKASRTWNRACDAAGKTSGKNTCGRDTSLPHVATHISFAVETRSRAYSARDRYSQAVAEFNPLPPRAKPTFSEVSSPPVRADAIGRSAGSRSAAAQNR